MTNICSLAAQNMCCKTHLSMLFFVTLVILIHQRHACIVSSKCTTAVESSLRHVCTAERRAQRQRKNRLKAAEKSGNSNSLPECDDPVCAKKPEQQTGEASSSRKGKRTNDKQKAKEIEKEPEEIEIEIYTHDEVKKTVSRFSLKKSGIFLYF